MGNKQNHLKMRVISRTHDHEKAKPFKCETCETVFTEISSLKRHIHIVHENKKYHNCDFCGKSFSKKHDLKRHIQYSHDSDFDMNNVKCSECTETFAKKSQLNHHLLIGKCKYIKFD